MLLTERLPGDFRMLMASTAMRTIACSSPWEFCLDVCEQSAMKRDTIEGSRSLMFKDLPDDVLEAILFKLSDISWSFTDLALCNRRMLSILLNNKSRFMWILATRPYVCMNGAMHAEVQEVHTIHTQALQHGLKYLKLGWISRLHLKCVSEVRLNVSRIGRVNVLIQASDEQVEEVIGNWPRNKVLLDY